MFIHKQKRTQIQNVLGEVGENTRDRERMKFVVLGVKAFEHSIE